MWLVARDSAATAIALAGMVIRTDIRHRMRVTKGAVDSGAGQVACARVFFAMGSERLTLAIVAVSSSRAPLVIDVRRQALEMAALSFVRTPLELGAWIWKRGD